MSPHDIVGWDLAVRRESAVTAALKQKQGEGNSFCRNKVNLWVKYEFGELWHKSQPLTNRKPS